MVRFYRAPLNTVRGARLSTGFAAMVFYAIVRVYQARIVEVWVLGYPQLFSPWS